MESAPATALRPAQLEELTERGFLVLPELFPTSALGPLLGELDSFLARKTSAEVAAGALSAETAEGFAGKRFDRKAASLCAALGEPPAHMPPTLSEVSQKSHTTAGMFQLMTHPTILDMVESALGTGEILVHPQFNMRGMLPGAGGVRWHQDLAFLEPEAEPTKFVNLWLPLTDITPTAGNGPLSVIAHSHRSALPHVTIHPPASAYSQVTVEPEVLASLPGERVCVDSLPAGGVIVFNHKTVHASAPNRSDAARWSLDIRYSELDKPTGRPATPGFVGRSRREPWRVAHSHKDWVALLAAGTPYVNLDSQRERERAAARL